MWHEFICICDFHGCTWARILPGCPDLDRRTIRVLIQSLWLKSLSARQRSSAEVFWGAGCNTSSNPNLEGQETEFVWPLSTAQMSMWLIENYFWKDGECSWGHHLNQIWTKCNVVKLCKQLVLQSQSRNKNTHQSTLPLAYLITREFELHPYAFLLFLLLHSIILSKHTALQPW